MSQGKVEPISTNKDIPKRASNTGKSKKVEVTHANPLNKAATNPSAEQPNQREDNGSNQ